MKKNKTNKKGKGFTLIELLIVIAIIGILASIVLVYLGSARTKAQKASAVSSLSSAMGELTSCADDEGFAAASAPTGGTTTVCCTDDACGTAADGHTEIWPDISTTGFSYDAPTGSLSGDDYIYTATNSTTSEVITCNYVSKDCQ
ncbi:MAG: type II secretion system protein [bacterium]|nr:type II secretion system protein [bacterium]